MQNSFLAVFMCSELTHIIFFIWRNSPQWAKASSFTRFLNHTQRRSTIGRIPLDEWSARRTDLYLTTPNTQNRQTSMPPVGFEPTVLAGERPQTYALDRTATGTGYWSLNIRHKQGIIKYFASFPTWYTFIFFLRLQFLQFFSTCFGPAGPSSGESNYTCSIWHLSLIRCYLVRGRWCWVTGDQSLS